MTKKLVLAIAVTAAALTACGSKDSYKAAKLNKMNQPSPEELNQRAARNIEINALKLIMADEVYASSKANAISEALKEETLGVSAKVTVGEKTLIEVSKLDSKAVECKETVKQVSVDNKSVKSLNRIDNFGRVACVDDGCENIVLLIETRRSHKTEENANGSILDGSVAVLLKKDATTGMHKPLNTESKDFLQINTTDIAVESCVELASRPKTGDEFAVQREQERQAEAKQKAAATETITGDELAIQRLREQQDARIKAIDERVKAIDARQKELASNKTMSDEPKALATERAKLLQERDSILDARKAPEAQPPMVEAQPADPS